MIVGILVIVVSALGIYFWDDLKTLDVKVEKLYEKYKAWKPQTLFDRNILTKKSKSSIYQDRESATAEIKRKYQEIIDARKYGTGSFPGPSTFATARNRIRNHSADGQKITEDERDFLWNGIRNRKRVPCINCEIEDMYEGPHGGMATNWRCPNCGQGINLTFFKNERNGFWCDNIGIDKSWIRK
jgi:hypothetical protein